MLGEHIEHAFQALAINEMRVDFVWFFPLIIEHSSLNYILRIVINGSNQKQGGIRDRF
jgi:hypothetical protein